MKRKITKLSLSLLVMTFLFTSNIFAADWYGCVGTPLTMDGGEKVPGTNFDSYTWDIRNSLDVSVKTATTRVFTETLTIPGKYKIILSVGDENSCTSDPREFIYYVLPPIAVTIDMGTNPSAYCTNEAATGTTLTATADTNPTGGDKGNATIGNYQWYSATDATGTGKASISGANTSTYQVTESVVKSYFYLASAKYTIPAGDIFVGVAGATCQGESTVKEIKVNAQPTTPTITITTP